MKDDIAERLLAQLMNWDVEELKFRAPRLQALATLKYDEYGQYRPGAKFAENLGIWLRQFDEGDQRQTALQFVETELLFVTERELSHIIELAYPDRVEPVLTREVAQHLGMAPWSVNAIRSHIDYRVARRRSLFLGLSDGARLDRFRRASPRLSHEQFAQEYEVADHLVARMTEDLGAALTSLESEAPSTFERVWLIDDFSGSGRTLIRHDDETESFKGKLPKFSQRLDRLVDQGFVQANPSVDVLLYIATTQAVEHVERTLADAGLDSWRLHVVYQLPHDIRVEVDAPFADLCRAYYDKSTEDVHKDHDTALGYSECALPLVLAHNTPNNSVCLLWAETGDEGLNRRALFPRYERHHKDRQ